MGRRTYYSFLVVLLRLLNFAAPGASGLPVAPVGASKKKNGGNPKKRGGNPKKKENAANSQEEIQNNNIEYYVIPSAKLRCLRTAIVAYCVFGRPLRKSLATLLAEYYPTTESPSVPQEVSEEIDDNFMMSPSMRKACEFAKQAPDEAETAASSRRCHRGRKKVQRNSNSNLRSIVIAVISFTILYMGVAAQLAALDYFLPIH